MVLSWIIALLWFAFLVAFVITGVLGAKTADEHSKRRLNNLTAVSFLALIILLCILAFIYVQELLVIAIVIFFITILTYRYVFTKEKTDSASDLSLSEKVGAQIVSLTKYNSRILALNFVVPLVLLTLAYLTGLTIQAESARDASSDVFLVSSGLLVIIVTFTIFTFERNYERDIHQEITKRLIQRFKGLGVIYVFTILLSVLSLILMTNEQLTFSPTSPLRNSLFLAVLYFFFISITLTLAVYFQVARVYEQGAED